MIKLQPSAAWANLTESWPKFGLSKLTVEQINSKLVTASWSTWSQSHDLIVFSMSMSFQQGFKEGKDYGSGVSLQKAYAHQALSVALCMGPSLADPKPITDSY